MKEFGFVRVFTIYLMVTVLLFSISACSKSKSTDPASTNNANTQTNAPANQQQTAGNANAAVEDDAESTIPDSDIYVAPLEFSAGTVKIGELKNITNNPGYDNQPFFLPDSNTILFTSRRGPEPENQQSDIYAHFVTSGKTVRMTNTPESEYSPVLTPSGESISTVRVELNSTQRVWEFPIQPEIATNQDFEVVFPEVERVGYYTWIDHDNAFVFRVDANAEGERHTLERASRLSGQSQKIATRIGRSFHMQPENNALAFVDKNSSPKWIIKLYGLERKLAVEMLPTPLDSEDFVWLDSDYLLMANEQSIYMNTIGKKYGNTWQEVSKEMTENLPGAISRLAVSPDRKWLAIVVTK